MATASPTTTVPSYIMGIDPKLLHQGAEARIYFTTLKSTPCFVKERFSKKYRIPELDLRLRKKQLKNELRSLELCKQNNIPCPLVLDADQNNVIVYLQQLPGLTVRQYIEGLGDLTADGNKGKIQQLATKIGTIVAQCHSVSLIHGDLTTSNMIIDVAQRSTENNSGSTTIEECVSLYLIDFGLAQVSDNVEEKAVDLYVLERAIETTHANSAELIKSTLLAYEKYLNDFTSAAINSPATPSPSTPSSLLIDQKGEELTTPATVDVDTNVAQSTPTEVQLQREAAKVERQKRKEAAKKKNQTVLGGKMVMARLNEVRARGRKKSMIG